MKYSVNYLTNVGNFPGTVVVEATSEKQAMHMALDIFKGDVVVLNAELEPSGSEFIIRYFDHVHQIYGAWSCIADTEKAAVELFVDCFDGCETVDIEDVLEL